MRLRQEYVDVGKPTIVDVRPADGAAAIVEKRPVQRLSLYRKNGFDSRSA
jgi:hypothetical protein